MSVHIPNTFQFLIEKDIPRVKLYVGDVYFKAKPMRDKNSEYYVSIDEYPYRRYPRFCTGRGFVLSRDVVVGMVNIHNSNDYFKIEDVYIGLLALRLGVDAHHEDMFLVRTSDCNCHKKEERRIVRYGGSFKNCMETMYNCKT